MFKTKERPYLTRLLDINSLSSSTIQFILNHAQFMLDTVVIPQHSNQILANNTLVTLFFEPSTRTKYSFDIAGQMLGATVINPIINNLSTLKGESLLDTIKTFEAMGANLFIVRHADDNIPEFISGEIQTNTALINAGDGCHQHPTQCLTDLLTIYQYKQRFQGLKVVLTGDIAHSRVAFSFIAGLQLMGVTDIHLVAPPQFIPDQIKETGLTISHSLEESLPNTDVIMTLRIQKERMEETDFPNIDNFHKKFGLTPSMLQLAKPDAMVMHPGPINRGVEIDSNVADGPQSTILTQVRNGIALRMAIMDIMLNRSM